MDLDLDLLSSDLCPCLGDGPEKFEPFALNHQRSRTVRQSTRISVDVKEFFAFDFRVTEFFLECERERVREVGDEV